MILRSPRGHQRSTSCRQSLPASRFVRMPRNVRVALNSINSSWNDTIERLPELTEVPSGVIFHQTRQELDHVLASCCSNLPGEIFVPCIRLPRGIQEEFFASG
jgi:hypothetical protein